MKSDVEIMLPKKKEIILYANMTEHQKNLQDHLVNKTLGNYLKEKMSSGKYASSVSCQAMSLNLKKNTIFYLYYNNEVIGRITT